MSPKRAPDSAAAPRDLLMSHLSDEFCLALGHVTAHFAALEDQLKKLASVLISKTDQELGQIVTAELPFRGVVTLASSLALHRVDNEALRQQIEQALTRAMQLEGHRNRVTHSDWWPGATREVRVRFKTTAKKGRGLVHATELVRATDIEAVAVEASAVAAEVAKVWLVLATR